MNIDFITYQLQHTENQENHKIAGILVEKAARFAHRHRQNDILAVFLSFAGDHRYTDMEIEQLAKEASGVFFQTKGSVTHAIQIIIEDLNVKILERNLDRGYEGIQAEGSVNIAVLHNDWLFMGQAGDAHTYLIRSGSFERFGDEGESAVKMGRTKRMLPRLYQSEINPKDLILMSPRAHGSWKAYYLSGSNELSMMQVKRRLHNQMIQDFSVLALKAEEGSGKVRHGEWDYDDESQSNKETGQADIPSVDNTTLKIEKDQTQEDTINEVISPDENTISISKKDSTRQETEKLSEVSDLPISIGQTEQQQTREELGTDSRKINTGDSNVFLNILARLWMKGKTLRAKAQLIFSRLVRKIAPNQFKKAPDVPYTLLMIIALGVPVIIILSSLTLYSRFGKEEQHSIFMNEAKEKAQQAETEDDEILKKELWNEVLSLSSKAEEYLVTNESRELFQTSQTIIDEMDLTARLDFRPALTHFFPEEATITRIQGGSSGVYLLDSNSGNLLRIYLNTKGFYELDEDFKCTPGSYGLVNVSKLIDFEILPANSENFKVMALDGEGNLLYCQPGEPPVSRTLIIPEGGWDRIVGTIYTNDTLYVVDAGRSMVWIYEGNASNSSGLSGIVFAESPIAFFDENIPDLGGAIDASINQEDLYVLHEDGHMTLCQYSSLKDVKLTECEDPAPFTDNRVGSENKNPWIFMGTHFIGVQQTRLPNTSLYILDNISSAFYQFSPQLNLERTLKPQINKNYPIPSNNPTGFGITPDLEVFIAFDNQLFIAPLQ